MTSADELSLSDRVRSFGMLGENPAPEALAAVVENFRAWARNGASPTDVAIVRDELVKRLTTAGVRAPGRIVDAALRGADGDNDRELSGQAIALTDPEPWPDPVDGAELLRALVLTLARYVALPGGGATAVALWILHTHAHDLSNVSAVLAIRSPEKRCGKTTLLHLLSALVPRPLPTANITPAALFRAVDRFEPCLLVDEADTFLTRNDELRGILNSGHARANAFVIRTVGDDYEARRFRTWCPKAMALIGSLPTTLEDRSITIRMRRKTKQEQVERLRLDRLGELEPLRRQAARWIQDHTQHLEEADPDIPSELGDRAQDNWRPLIAIADLAGGPWPDRARKAAKLLSAADGDDEDSAGVQLLADLRGLFEERETDRLFSADIVEALGKMEDRPWPEWRRGQPLTATSLARLLKPFGVRPKTIRIGDDRAKGYAREDLEDPLSRYLPPTSRDTRDNAITARENPGFPNRDKGGDVTARESRENPHHTYDVTAVTVRKGGPGDPLPPDAPICRVCGKLADRTSELCAACYTDGTTRGFPSESEPGTRHAPAWTGTGWECDCKGWQFQRKCWHVQAVEEAAT